MDYDLLFDNPRKSYQYKSWSMTVVRSRLEVNERSKSNGISPFSIRRYQVIISCIQGYSCTTMRITKRRCESEQIEAGIKYSHSMDCTNVTPVHKIGTVSKGLESGLLECCQYTVYRSPITFPKVGIE